MTTREQPAITLRDRPGVCDTDTPPPVGPMIAGALRSGARHHPNYTRKAPDMPTPELRSAPAWAGVPVLLDIPDLAAAAAAVTEWPLNDADADGLAALIRSHGVTATIGAFLSEAVVHGARGECWEARYCLQQAAHVWAWQLAVLRGESAPWL